MTELVLDAAGRRRSPATMPGFHADRPPRNKGIRYPADPPTVEEIVAVMRTAGDGPHGRRLRGLVVVLWRAGLRIHEPWRSASPIWTAGAARCSCAAARAAAVARSAWTSGRGNSLPRGAPCVSSSGGAAVLRHQRSDARATVVSRRRAHPAAAHRGGRRRASTLRAPSATPRARGRDGPRGRPADRHPATARPHQPRDHLDLPAGHRQHRDHPHRPRPPTAHGPGRRNASPLTA